MGCINADGEAAYGAALLASNLTGAGWEKAGDLVLLEVMPLSLGMDIVNDVMSRVIKRNTPIPTKQVAFYMTISDNQDSVCVSGCMKASVREQMTITCWARFNCQASHQHHELITQLRVAFIIANNGILHASAQDASSEKENSISITTYKGRPLEEEEDRERMLKNAEKFEQEDEKARSKMEAKYELEGCIHSLKRRLDKDEITLKHGKTIEEIY